MLVGYILWDKYLYLDFYWREIGEKGLSKTGEDVNSGKCNYKVLEYKRITFLLMK